MRKIRKINNVKKPELFLTFDDGPLPGHTDNVLRILKKHGANATFFLIARRAEENPQLVEQILKEGHALGNHSLDHNYWKFFSTRTSMMKWLLASKEVFRDHGWETVGFRPPLGFYTPEMKWSLEHLDWPMVLWNRRFFDVTKTWTISKAEKSLKRVSSGDIILLHDVQRPHRQIEFYKTLDWYLGEGKNRGFEWASLNKSKLEEFK